MEKLSSREKEILELVGKGYDNKEIADQLYISLSTVKNHISNVYKKLNLKSRAKAITYYYKQQMKQNGNYKKKEGDEQYG